MTANENAFIHGLMGFIQAAPTPFHAVLSVREQLNGFTELREADKWKLSPGGKYFVTRNDSSIVAFTVGSKAAAESGFRLVGAHTDSPCLKLRPVPELKDRHYLRLGVEVYGGVLLATWFDRDLSLAGRVYFATEDGKSGHALINFERPIAVVPNLAIHLNRSANENRTINKQTEMPPLVGHFSKAGFEDALLEELARVGVKGAARVTGHDLSFYDTQAPALVGLHEEFLAAARIDNLLSCYVGANALSTAGGAGTAVLACNDHEEVGSASAPGAQGTFLRCVLERLAGSSEDFSRAIALSTMVSTDNAHGVHPSYPEKHDSNHQPILNAGPAIKTNTNQRYATTGETAALFADCCEDAGVPVQQFVARNDMPCGSTIGPITASVLGVKTVDVGVPTFAMHSIREMAGTEDAQMLAKALAKFYALS
jgi:aspartyl aminopeptidase